MFVGKYEVKLDTKNRVIVPQKIREEKTESGILLHSEFYLTMGKEGCICVRTPDGWEELMGKLGATEQDADEDLRVLQRTVAATTVPSSCDSQGRIVLPAEFRAHAGLKRNVLWVGAVTRAEIWDVERWREAHARDVSQGNEKLRVATKAGFALPGS